MLIVSKVVSILPARGDLYSLQIDVIKLDSYVREDPVFFPTVTTVSSLY